MPSPKREPIRIWATGQIQPRHQRSEYYVTGTEHPAKMWPAIARAAIETYTSPGEIVLDPMCGIGTTLVEAILLGRHAFGVDLEAKWVRMARANVRATGRAAPDAWGEVYTGNAANLPALLEGKELGAVDMVLTSPPYGAVTHGQPDTAKVTGGKIRQRANRYSTGRKRPGSLVTSSQARLQDGLQSVFGGCLQVLRPGGHMVVTARPFTDSGDLVDFPSLVIRAALAAGFDLAARHAALLARWDGTILHPHATFFHLANTRATRAAGQRVLLRTHEDVLVFRRPV